MTSLRRGGGPGIPAFPDEVLVQEMERTSEPAFLILPGGRIGAANRAAVRLAGFPLVGTTVNAHLNRYGARRVDGRRLIRGDLPHTRSLRGEVVDIGELLEMTLPDGSFYRALVTSTPVVVDGTVVGSLSVFHDFDAYVRDLACEQTAQDPAISPEGGVAAAPNDGSGQQVPAERQRPAYPGPTLVPRPSGGRRKGLPA